MKETNKKSVKISSIISACNHLMSEGFTEFDKMYKAKSGSINLMCSGGDSITMITILNGIVTLSKEVKTKKVVE